jgi:hypothetical protein
MPAHRKKDRLLPWSSRLAYAVGLITTDGCLSPDGRHLEFLSNDQKLVETFKECLKLQNTISRKRSGYTGKKNAYRVQFGDVVLYRFLVNIGLMPNKSKSLNNIDLPDKFFFDFLRGHLDGDGTIRRYQDPIYPNSTRLYLSFVSASLLHVRWLQKKIQYFTNREGFIRKSTRVYTLTFSKYDTINLLKHIYYRKSIPCLQRKLDIAREFITSPR